MLVQTLLDHSVQVPISLVMGQRMIPALKGHLALEGNTLYHVFPTLLLTRSFVIVLHRGPGWETSDYESNRIIGQQQSDMALELYKTKGAPLTGVIDSRSKIFDMTTIIVNGTNHLCPPAMGFAFGKFRPSLQKVMLHWWYNICMNLILGN